MKKKFILIIILIAIILFALLRSLFIVSYEDIQEINYCESVDDCNYICSEKRCGVLVFYNEDLGDSKAKRYLKYSVKDASYICDVNWCSEIMYEKINMSCVENKCIAVDKNSDIYNGIARN